MRRGTLAVVVLSLLALSGCAAAPHASDANDLMTTSIDSSTVPAFLNEPQEESDILAAEDLEGSSIDPSSTRFEGRWEDWDVYLGVSGKYTVNIISVDPDTHRVVSYGHGIGNSVAGLGEPISLQYLPQGTSEVPDGWHALTEWIIVRD